MANTDIQKANDNASLKELINEPAMKDRLVEILGKNSGAFISTVLTIYNGSSTLQECSPKSVLSAAISAATLNLPVSPALGLAYIVPRKVGGTYTACFQLGYKGLIQLMLRSDKVVRVNANKIYEGQFKGFDPFTGDPIRGEKISDEVVGYMAYVRLTNGFEHWEYMSIDEIEKLAKKYSMSYKFDKSGSSVWSTNFDAMAKKTVILKLKTFAAISTDLQRAVEAEQAPVPDNIDMETGEVLDGGSVDEIDVPFAEDDPMNERP